MDKLPIVLGRLPWAIQNEIYEFARGNRAHWKEQMAVCHQTLFIWHFETRRCASCSNYHERSQITFKKFTNQPLRQNGVPVKFEPDCASFWRRLTRRYTQFAIEPVEIEFQAQMPAYGRTVSVVI